MTSTPKQNIELENRVFCRWFSYQLAQGNSKVQVNEISKDLSNGVAFVELSKVLTGKEPKRQWAEDPKKPVEMIQNNDLSVQMFYEDGVHLIGIAGKDIRDNNIKIIRGYIWTLIERYSIGRASYGDSTKEETKSMSFNDILMSWATRRVSNYQNVHNFQPYPLAMCALLDSFVPDKINFASLNPQDAQHNAQLAANVMKELGIPVYILPEESEDEMDIKVLLTQLAAARICLEKLPPVPAVKIEENRIISKVSDCVPTEEPEPKQAPAPAPAPVAAPAPAPVAAPAPAPVAAPAPTPVVQEPDQHPASGTHRYRCVNTHISRESLTNNGQTVEKITKVESYVDESGKGHTTTTVTETTTDKNGHKTTKTSTSTEDGAPAIDFKHGGDFNAHFNHNDDFDAEFNRMKEKMDANFKNFSNNHPALK